MPFFDFLDPAFFTNLLSIVMINIVLSGDNSIVIAMAVLSLPKEKRFIGILVGTFAAVLMRVIFTFFVAKLLMISLIKLIGGLLLLWIAIKLLVGNNSDTKQSVGAQSVWSAVWIILFADLTMSLDNILAVAGASHGSVALLLFGLGSSIPLVVFASALISKLMERFPLIVWAGALILGKVAGEMIVTDPWLVNRYWVKFGLVDIQNAHPVLRHIVVWDAEIAGILVVLVISLLVTRIKAKRLKLVAVETNTSV